MCGGRGAAVRSTPDIERPDAVGDLDPRGRPRWRAVRTWPAEAWIILVAVVGRIPLVFAGITFRTDIWRQADTASIARNFVHQGNLFYPRINWGGSGPGFVEAELQVYPWIVSWWYRLFGDHVWLGLATALALSTVTMVLFWRLASRLLPRTGALAALVFFVASPAFIRYSVAFMPEAMALLWYVAALWWFDRWLERPTWRATLWWSGCAAMAALVKPTTLHIGIVIAVAIILRRGWRRALTRQTAAGAAIIVAPVAVWLWHARSLYEEYGNTFGILSGGDRKIGQFSDWTSTTFYSGALHVDFVWVLAGVGVIPLVVGLAVALSRRSPAMVLGGLVGLAVYYFTSARYISVDYGVQYHVYTVVFAALLVGIGFEWGRARLDRVAAGARTVGRIAVAGLIAAFAVVVSFAYGDHFRDRGASVTACGKAVAAVVPEDELVIISSTSSALLDGAPNNYQDPAIFYFANRKGWSLASDQQDPALVEADRLDGGRYVITQQYLLDQNPSFADYLARAELVMPANGSAPSSSCLIYRLPTA